MGPGGHQVLLEVRIGHRTGEDSAGSQAAHHAPPGAIERGGDAVGVVELALEVVSELVVGDRDTMTTRIQASVARTGQDEPDDADR